jgi:hypothetical protein
MAPKGEFKALKEDFKRIKKDSQRKKEQGDFQPTLETQSKSENTTLRKKGAESADNHANTLKSKQAEIEKEIELLKQSSYSHIQVFEAIEKLGKMERKMFKDAFELCKKEAELKGLLEGIKLQKEEILKIIDNFRSEVRCSDCGIGVPCDDCNSDLILLDKLKQRINQSGEKE